MPKQKDLKRLIRTRMKKTGEAWRVGAAVPRSDHRPGHGGGDGPGRSASFRPAHL